MLLIMTDYFCILLLANFDSGQNLESFSKEISIMSDVHGYLEIVSKVR